MADNDILQVFADSRVDSRSLSEFMYKAADFMVQRRLAPPINTLNYYLDKFNAVTVSANNSIGAANAVIAEANKKILATDGVVADAYAGAEQRFFDTANNNLNSQIDIYLSAQDIGKSVFDTPQAGVDAGIANGSYYSVRSTDSDYFLEEYKNNAGTPQATGKKYPAAKFLLTKGVFTVSELLILGATATAGARFNTHGFYTKGDCLPSVFEVQTVAVGDVFTDIGNGTLIGSDASIKINSTKKLKLIANESVALSQLGGIKTAQSVTIKNDVIGSVILKNYKRLIIDGFYTLRGTLWHYESNIITGIGKKISGIRMGDNVNKYPIQSVNSNIKAIVLLNDYLEMCNFTLDGNTAKNKARVYSQDINLSYWGFGAALFNINEFYIHDMHVKETEAWGISYNLCNIVRGENITFDQPVEVGLNKDGITGSGRRVTYKNISGYTSDDLTAVGCGKSSLQGFDCGITVNQDIEYIDIDGVEGLSKNGQGTHYGVGLYGPDNTVIKNISVRNVKGIFNAGVIRIKNYWYQSSNLKVGYIELNNIAPTDVQSTRKNHIFIDYVDCPTVSIDGITYNKNGDSSDPLGGNIIQVRESNISNVSASNISIKQTASTQNVAVLLTSMNGNVKNLTIDGVVATKDTTGGSLVLVEESNSALANISVSRLSFNNLKTDALLINIRYMSANNGTSLSIDSFALPTDLTSYIIPQAGVTPITTEATIKNSTLFMNLVFDVNVTSLTADKVLFKFGTNFVFKKITSTKYLPKSSPTGANFNIKVDSNNIVMISPSLTGVTNTGTYRIYANLESKLL